MRRPTATHIGLGLSLLYSLMQQRDIRRLTELALLQRNELNFVRCELQSHGVRLGIAPPPARDLRLVPPAG